MELIPLNYKNVIFQNPYIGFALHKIVTDKSGQPVDYEYIEVNKQFEKYTGLKASKIIGKRITEIVPGFEKEGYSWIKFFGNVALSGKSDEIEQYAENFKKWYSVLALCPAKGYFIALFYDITQIKKNENKLKLINEEYAALNEEYLAQNEELTSLLEESHEKKQLLEKAIQEDNKNKKELQRREILQNSILNSTPSGLLAVNNHGEILFSNNKFYEMWQIPDHIRSEKDDAKLINYTLSQLNDPDGFVDKVKLLYKSNEISNDIITFKDNRIFERYSEPLIEKDQIIGRTWSFNDVTEKELQRSRLERLNMVVNGIRSINRLQASETDPSNLINEICKNLVTTFGFEAAMITLFENGSFLMGAQEGFGDRYTNLERNLKKGIKVPCLEKASRIKDLVVIDHPEEYCVNCINHNKNNVKCAFVVPISSNNRIFGFFNVNVSKDIVNDNELYNLLRELGDEIGVALLKIELEKKQEVYIEEIKLRENKLNSILQSSPIGIGYVKNRIFYTINDKFCKITGYSISELTGEQAKKLYTNDRDYKEVGRILKKLESEFSSESIEVKWKRKDGKIIDVLLNIAKVNPINSNDGFSVTAEDITERKQIEQIHEEKKEFYYALFEKNNAIKLLINPDTGKIEDANTAACKFYGYSLDQLRNMKVQEINLLPENEVQKEMQNALKEEKKSYEFKHKLATGEIKDVMVYSGPIKYANRDLLYSIIYDITEQKKTEKELKESEEKYRILIENQGEGVVHVDLNENVLFINPAGAKIFGMEINQIIGQNLSDFLDKEQFDLIKSETLKRIKGETSTYELIVNNKKGYKITILLTATPIYKNSKVVGNLGIFRNITDRKRDEIILKQKNEELQAAEEELRASNDELHTVNTELEKSNQELKIAKEKAESADKLKSAFLANMSHEIRTPMNSILGFSELLKNNNLPSEKQKHFIDIININGAQLISIIDDIIDFSKIEANQLELRYSRVDLIQTCEEIHYTYKKRAQLENLDIKVNLEVPLVNEFIIETDMVRLKQVISNLVGNALKFTQIGQITLGFKESNKELTFFVKDTGIGIAPDKFEIIFERFRQVDDSKSRKFGGTGLGLTISKRIIDLLGGRMWVESVVDEGSQFYFTIPLA